MLDTLMYLGATLQKEAHHGAELSRRIGLARKDFDSLSSVWSHAGISRERKCQIYNACIVSKLLYGVQTIWLNKGDRRRLDAFHCMCLRRCCGIPHSYISRIGNEEVLRVASDIPLSNRILGQQLLLFARYAGMPVDTLTRRYLFDDGTLEPRRWMGPKRRGRPRSDWIKKVYDEALRVVDSDKQLLERLLLDASQARVEWRSRVCRIMYSV